jgi:hypothetical protein
MVWNKIKDYIQKHFREKLGYPALQIAVKEAWEAVKPAYLPELLAKMRDRCQAVIDAKGMHTKY